MRSRAGLVAAMALALAVVPPTAARACSCAAEPIGALFDGAVAVFSGPVVEVRRGEVLTAEVAVREVHKGVARARQSVVTGADEAGCGVGFVAGNDYTIFASGQGLVVETNLCSGTSDDAATAARARTIAERRGALGELITLDVEPVDEGGGRAGPIAAALLLIAAGTGGLAAFIRARRRPGRA